MNTQLTYLLHNYRLTNISILDNQPKSVFIKSMISSRQCRINLCKIDSLPGCPILYDKSMWNNWIISLNLQFTNIICEMMAQLTSKRWHPIHFFTSTCQGTRIAEVKLFIQCGYRNSIDIILIKIDHIIQKILIGVRRF